MIRSRFQLVLRLASVLTVLGALSVAVRADVTVPALLADHMVVQRGLPVHVWGMAAPHEAVSVTFRGETKSCTADDDGRWSIYLSPGEASGPFQMNIKATNTIALTDILVGDVWVASGQSNMELPMTALANAQTEIAAAQYPKIRLFMVKQKPADYPLEDVESKGWAACTPETVARSSAVAYFFARHLQQKLGVPIGLVESFWGGTAAESWTSLHALSADAALMPVFAARAKTGWRRNPPRFCASSARNANFNRRSSRPRLRASRFLGGNGIRISRRGRQRRSTTA